MHGDDKTLELPLLPARRSISRLKGPAFDSQQPLYSSETAHHGSLPISKKFADPAEVRRRRLADPFHTLIALSTPKVIGIIIILYLFLVALIAILLWLNHYIHGACNLQMNNFLNAWWFALETVTTIGYGTPPEYDIYFDGCMGVWIIVDLAAISNMVFNAGVLSAIFVRISRVQPRGSSILFSRHAILSKAEGNWQFKFRVVELRKHQLTEAHVRCYAIFAETSPHGERHFVQRELRLAQPDDDYGWGMLFSPVLLVNLLGSPRCPELFSCHAERPFSWPFHRMWCTPSMQIVRWCQRTCLRAMQPQAPPLSGQR